MDLSLVCTGCHKIFLIIGDSSMSFSKVTSSLFLLRNDFTNDVVIDSWTSKNNTLCRKKRTTSVRFFLDQAPTDFNSVFRIKNLEPLPCR